MPCRIVGRCGILATIISALSLWSRDVNRRMAKGMPMRSYRLIGLDHTLFMLLIVDTIESEAGPIAFQQ